MTLFCFHARQALAHDEGGGPGLTAAGDQALPIAAAIVVVLVLMALVAWLITEVRRG